MRGGFQHHPKDTILDSVCARAFKNIITENAVFSCNAEPKTPRIFSCDKSKRDKGGANLIDLVESYRMAPVSFFNASFLKRDSSVCFLYLCFKTLTQVLE